MSLSCVDHPHWRQGLVPRRSMLGLLALVLAGCARPGLSTAAATLDATPAPTFSLKDASGKPFSLVGARGQVVLLTFLYTHCPDVCPLIASKLYATLQLLGSDTSRLRVVAVSVDPVGDTPASVAQFSAAHQMTGKWVYLLGSLDQLAPVWQDYHVGASAVLTSSAGSVTHTALVYLIDRHGREQALYQSDFAPRDLAHDIRALLGQ